MNQSEYLILLLIVPYTYSMKEIPYRHRKSKKLVQDLYNNNYMKNTNGKMPVKTNFIYKWRAKSSNEIRNFEALMGTKFDNFEKNNIRRLQLLDLQMIKPIVSQKVLLK